MPAMPIAESSPPIVVGIRHTSSATRMTIGCSASANIANGWRVTVASRKMIVSPASRMLSAISFGVFWRDGAFDERDHPVEERLAGAGGDAHDDLVGEARGCRR